VRRLLFTLLLLAVPRVALACPVCFGQSDSPMALAANMGILFMLGVTVSVLAAFACFFVYLMRRANLAADTGSSGETDPYVLSTDGPVLHATESRFFASNPAQKGTPRC